MHIFIVHQYYLHKKGAGGSRWNQFAKYWAQGGHKVTVLAATVHYTTGKKHREYKGKFVVRLNSIPDSAKSVFNLIEHASKRLSLD